MKKEIVIVDTNVQNKTYPQVFPLSPTHRKELRDLRSRNISDLQIRVSMIRNEKLKEFREKNIGIVLKEVTRINKIMEEEKKKYHAFVEEFNVRAGELNVFIQLKNVPELSYHNNMYRINLLDKGSRTYEYDTECFITKEIERMFDEKYSEGFTEVKKRIYDLTDKYEEAINFGDLEIVKTIYFELKNADLFLNKLREMKI